MPRDGDSGKLALDYGSELYLLRIVSSPEAPPSMSPYLGYAACEKCGYDDAAKSYSREELTALAARRLSLTVHVEIVIHIGSVAEEIAAVIEVNEIDLLVLATHGIGGWDGRVLGSVAHEVLVRVQFPTLLVPCVEEPALSSPNARRASVFD